MDSINFDARSFCLYLSWTGILVPQLLIRIHDNTIACNVLAEETTDELLELQAPHKSCCGNGAKSINFYKMEG